MQETWVRSRGWEDPLEEGMATHTSIPAWRIPWTRGAWQTTVHRVAKNQTQVSMHAYLFWRDGEHSSVPITIGSCCTLFLFCL